jgi:membrane-associated phospholipid phosphatase
LRIIPLIRRLVRVALIAAPALVPRPAFADQGVWGETCEFASGAGGGLYVAVGLAAPLVTDGKEGTTRCLRTADALLTAGAICEGLKWAVTEERPDGSGKDSFPSAHTTAAFAVAEMQSHFHPKQRWLWYSGATLIAASRVETDRHYWWDVAAGAALGYGVARWQLTQRRGLALAPFIRPERGGASVSLAMRF